MYLTHIFKNRNIWLLAFSCVVISVVRVTFQDWGKLYLSEHGNVLSISFDRGWLLTLGGLLGILAAGWFSDKFSCDNRCRANILFHLGLIALLLVFWLVPGDVIVSWYLYLMVSVSFFSLGAQLLIFIAAVELSDRKVAGIVAGLIILIAGTGPIFSNVLIGEVVQNIGWNYFFVALCGCMVLSAIAQWFCKDS
jgi:sugar phosphate permease